MVKRQNNVSVRGIGKITEELLKRAVNSFRQPTGLLQSMCILNWIISLSDVNVANTQKFSISRFTNVMLRAQLEVNIF